MRGRGKRGAGAPGRISRRASRAARGISERCCESQCVGSIGVVERQEGAVQEASRWVAGRRASPRRAPAEPVPRGAGCETNLPLVILPCIREQKQNKLRVASRFLSYRASMQRIKRAQLRKLDENENTIGIRETMRRIAKKIGAADLAGLS
jgi:hypothetical protein